MVKGDVLDRMKVYHQRLAQVQSSLETTRQELVEISDFLERVFKMLYESLGKMEE